MKLIIGGYHAGKREFTARQWGYAEENFSRDLQGGPLLRDAHLLLRDNPAEWQFLLPPLLEKEVVLCDEVGGGVIPLDKADREWREAVGRLTTALAAEADEVWRVCAGLGMRLKGKSAT